MKLNLTAAGLVGLLSLTFHTDLEAQENALTYEPLIGVEGKKKVRLDVPVFLNSRFEGVSSFAVDRDNTEFSHGGTILPQARIGLRADAGEATLPFLLHFEYEHDLVTGVAAGRSTLDGQAIPGTAEVEQEIRNLFVRASYLNFLHAKGGLATSHWGLGLLANDGAHRWKPGSAYFGDPRSGDRNIRGQLATGPWTDANLMAVFAIDSVVGDDILQDGDKAIQIIGALRMGYNKPTFAGVYVVHRRQDTEDGRYFNVTAVDATAGGIFKFGNNAELTLAGEAAAIFGDTTFAANADIPVQDIAQFGATARANLKVGDFGGVFDFIYASGDRNFDDATQNGFKADPNYEVGLLLFRNVMAAQTGRAAATAGDPNLVGVASPGLERYPTQGSVTNTFSFFPRVYAEPVEGLHIYTGPLFAFAAVPLMDPLNSRAVGGGTRNALNGTGGTFYGTEIDVGVRYQTYIEGTELTAGLEGGVLLPGDAFDDENGDGLGTVYGGRFMLQYRL